MMLACFVAGFFVTVAVTFSECNGQLFPNGRNRQSLYIGRIIVFTMAALGLAVARYL